MTNNETEKNKFQNLYKKEKLKHLEEENQLKNKIITLNEQKIIYLENRIKELENKEKNEIFSIKNLPINPKFIYMLCDGKKYVFISYRNYESDKINNENTKLAILTNFSSNNTQVKWIFNYKKNNIASIIFDIENEHKMFNWKIYSDGNSVCLSKNMESLFEIIMIDFDRFYIKDYKSGKYLCNNKNERDENSYFIELKDKIDEKEAEKFVFYYDYKDNLD